MNKLLTTLALVAFTSAAFAGGASAGPGAPGGGAEIGSPAGGAGGFQSPQYNGGGGFKVGGASPVIRAAK